MALAYFIYKDYSANTSFLSFSSVHGIAMALLIPRAGAGFSKKNVD